jgi:hypothetical protein
MGLDVMFWFPIEVGISHTGEYTDSELLSTGINLFRPALMPLEVSQLVKRRAMSGLPQRAWIDLNSLHHFLEYRVSGDKAWI